MTIAQEIIYMIENGDMAHWSDAHDKAVIAAMRSHQDLIPQDQLFVCGQMGANVTRVFVQPDEAADALESTP